MADLKTNSIFLINLTKSGGHACCLFDKNMAENRSPFQSKVNIDVGL